MENLENAVKGEPEGESEYWEITLGGRSDLVIPAELIKQNGDRVIVKDDRHFFKTYMSLHKDHRYVPEPEPEDAGEDEF